MNIKVLYKDGCYGCKVLINELTRQLKGSGFKVLPVNVDTKEGQSLNALALTHGLLAFPMVFIGDTVLCGTTNTVKQIISTAQKIDAASKLNAPNARKPILL